MIKFAKAIGANTDLLTAQAFIYQSSLAVLISGGGDDVFIKVRLVNPIIEENFFSSQEQPSSKIPKLIEILKHELSGVENLEMLLVFLQGDVLYLYSTGTHKVYLKREDKISDLISQEGSLISGFFKENDKLLLLNSNPKDGWTKDTLDDFLAQQADSFEEEFELYLQKSQTVNPVAAILIESKSENVPVLEQQINLKPQKENQITEILGKFFSKKEEESFNSPPKPLIFNGGVKNLFIKSVMRNKKTRLFFVISLMIIVIIGISGSYYSKQNAQKHIQFAKILTETKEKFAAAQNLKDSDAQLAKQNLDEAKKDLEQALKLEPKNKEILVLKKEIEGSNNDILKVLEISDWPLFLSMDLIKKDFSVKRMSLAQSKILLLGDGQKTLVSIDVNKKTNQILGGTAQLGNAKLASINGGSAFVYSEDKGVVKIDLLSFKSSQIIKPDEGWGKISDIFGFAGNIYLLDSEKNQIWKYLPTTAGYSDKNSYLKKEIDLVGADRIKIDYSVWVLKKGEILKFTAGNEDFFSIGGLDKPIKNIDGFFVPEDLDNVYILDKFNSRIVVVKKNGQYLSQIIGEKFKNTDDFVVDADSKKLYLLESNNIYQLELK